MLNEEEITSRSLRKILNTVFWQILFTLTNVCGALYVAVYLVSLRAFSPPTCAILTLPCSASFLRADGPSNSDYSKEAEKETSKERDYGVKRSVKKHFLWEVFADSLKSRRKNLCIIL